MNKMLIGALTAFLTVLIMAGCPQPTDPGKTVDDGGGTVVIAFPEDTWAWMKGSDTSNRPEVYGELGVPSLSNVPGARAVGLTLADDNGTVWLFGGYGMAPGFNSAGSLNDLWRYRQGRWTWMSGSQTQYSPGVYGEKGTADDANTPGARYNSSGCLDSQGNLWLFGGRGRDASGNNGALNDLWMFDGSQWTWIAGSDASRQSGTYSSSHGSASQDYAPGGREGAALWIDSDGDFWVFGGRGHDADGTLNSMNDLWKYDPNLETWTWVSGSNQANPEGVYGEKGVAADDNTPSGRYTGAYWNDSNGNLWQFGGIGSTSGLNDLWKFNIATSQWTWVTGSNSNSAPGSYGQRGVAADSNTPGSRYRPGFCTDSQGNFWLYGGSGSAATAASGNLSDLWKFDGTWWTWVAGSNTLNVAPDYGTLGIPSQDNVPPSRKGTHCWFDTNNRFWLFGGTDSSSRRYSDFWCYVP